MKIAPFTYTMGGAIPICGLDEERGHVAGHDAGHGVCRVVRPILDLVAGRFCFHEVVGRGNEFVIHAVEGLADGRTDAADIHESVAKEALVMPMSTCV